jgi:hypothetical protein
MSETINLTPVKANLKRLGIFQIRKCPNCKNASKVSSTYDGNRTQTCYTCGKTLLKNGKCYCYDLEEKCELCKKNL